MTIAELFEEVKSFTGRADVTTAQLNLFLINVHRQITRSVRLPEMDTLYEATVPSEAVLPIPGGFLQAYDVTLNGVDAYEYDDYEQAGGLFMFNKRNAGKTFRVLFSREVEPETLFDSMGDVYIFGLCSMVATYEQDMEMANTYSSMFANALNSVKSLDSDSQHRVFMKHKTGFTGF